jgi:hypothetical protein
MLYLQTHQSSADLRTDLASARYSIAHLSELLFVLYKLADNWFTMKCKTPFSPFVAFAFGIALALIGHAT